MYMTSPTKFHHVILMILYMLSCEQSIITLAFFERGYHNLYFIRIWLEKPLFLRGGLGFKFSNLGLALGRNWKLYTSVAKRLKLKVRKFWWLVPTFVEATGEKLLWGTFLGPPILTTVKKDMWRINANSVTF